MRTLVTSDTHFGHADKEGGACLVTKRGFTSLEAMDAHMIARWNQVVKPGDYLIHVGDFCMGPSTNIQKYVSQLNGYKILVAGNHDRSRTAMLRAGFQEYHKALTWSQDGKNYFFKHRPWEPRADVHQNFCGHIHETWKQSGPWINVGVDQWDFTPRTIQELLTVSDAQHPDIR